MSFGYPAGDGIALTDVSLHLPAGQVVALIGENGAGKSTLVKLLCRLYEPTTGSISLDGVDLQRFEVTDWRDRVSAGFQDYCHYEVLVREAVGVGDIGRVDDDEAVHAGLARAGAADMVDALPAGLNTQLGTSWDEGVDLSGGQWQKLALGRAFMSERPLLLVLDEPTAALDADAEHALFERFADSARSGAARGQITVFVSHRFSTVRMADLIVVLDAGRVVESGTHHELMTRNGLYAELYALGRRAYR